MAIVRRRPNIFQPENNSELFYLCGSFLIGAVIGSFFASGFRLEPDGVIASYFNYIITEAAVPSLRGFLLLNSLFLLVLFLGTVLRIGSCIIPITIAVKGLVFSAEITCFIKLFGLKGYFPAITSMFLSSIITVSAIILFSCQSMEYNRYSSKRSPGAILKRAPIGRELIISAVLSFLLIVVAGIIHCYLMPFFTLMTVSIVY